MAKVDRRILKSQAAIKKAMIELMSDKSFDHITLKDISDRADVSRRTIYLHYQDKYDLLDKLIEEHIQELRESCESDSEISAAHRNLTWFEYFEKNYLFFSAMLSSKGAPFFRSRFLEFVIEDIKNEWDMAAGKKRGLYEDVIVQFIAPAYVGIVEWWFSNEMPYPPHVMEAQLEILLESNLS
ncbi:TetR/AcrR family transcriptional regulator [Paenibacillus sp. FSL K6-3166]|uniref:TetR/AcrR family transcriptional regulator n=1 Tax=unclassified Paenibacillus TaxID=185978 RepID=UPI000BA107ED|nr:TetR/AcrR family transcriptional regulator [Paenibacillus sp. VTT E-133291]OZQ98568.1 TetR family transcriptional regulator [Paenibacillus sp. VTT E-133291]